MFRRCGGFFPLLLTFFILAAIFVSTLNATGLSHQELSAAPREKRDSNCYDDNGKNVDCPDADEKDRQRAAAAARGPAGDTGSGVEKIGYGFGLMVAALFAYLFFH